MEELEELLLSIPDDMWSEISEAHPLDPRTEIGCSGLEATQKEQRLFNQNSYSEDVGFSIVQFNNLSLSDVGALGDDYAESRSTGPVRSYAVLRTKEPDRSSAESGQKGPIRSYAESKLRGPVISYAISRTKGPVGSKRAARQSSGNFSMLPLRQRNVIHAQNSRRKKLKEEAAYRREAKMLEQDVARLKAEIGAKQVDVRALSAFYDNLLEDEII